MVVCDWARSRGFWVGLDLVFQTQISPGAANDGGRRGVHRDHV